MDLPTFINAYMPDYFVNVSIFDECRRFIRDKQNLPVVFVDLFGLLRLLMKDPTRRKIEFWNIDYEKFEDFLKRLSEVAMIIFFNHEAFFNDNQPKDAKAKEEELKKIAELVYDNASTFGCKKIPDVEFIIPTSHLESIAHKYGAFKFKFTPIPYPHTFPIYIYFASILRSFAILSDDPQFLCPLNLFRFISLRYLNFDNFMTKEYSREKLNENPNLNDEKLALLATILGKSNFNILECRWRNHQIMKDLNISEDQDEDFRKLIFF